MLPVMAAAALLSACVRAPIIERAYGPNVVEGRFIEPPGYASFLRGAIAEADGEPKAALSAYEDVARIDPGGPEVWTRIGDIRCRVDARDARAASALARALALDPTYAPALAATASCSLARGDVPSARAAARRAAELDPTADRVNVLLTRIAPVEDDQTQAALLALTVTAREKTVAWEALSTWSKRHGHVALWARAQRELVRLDPSRRDDVAGVAEELAGFGETSEARSVAAAAAESDDRPLGPNHPLAARLAVDEAVARGDWGAVSRRCTRVRLPLDEAAGRALLSGDRAKARDLAWRMVQADSTAIGARLVVSAAAREHGDESSVRGDVLAAALDARSSGRAAPAAALVAFGMVLVHTASVDDARSLLASVPREPIVSGDDLVVRPAVELASRGVLSEDALPPDGLVELAALRGKAPPEAMLRQGAPLDARHEYLAVALAHPQSARARELADRFGGASADPIVASASALIELATGAPIAAAAPGALLSRNGADPVLAATALRLAEKVGDDDVARRARAVLTALAGGRPASVE